ncbi:MULTISPECIES: AlpA family transcriptional regulator [unclassified Ruegeria]|uniref:helix-turn-helix transcriptional regulator n=1 Tax=unclassified Ruegeria TaxID=2625375 RepID=UPI0014929F5D|nr:MULTISPECIES: hypothetical protein [unclassified Ruegeria]NOD36829.1 hypothetical protein [Ruegeria sp. HKCCD7296]NOE43988.1 hypothetical protein [Ruegeria sp. HKCCD7319]
MAKFNHTAAVGDLFADPSTPVSQPPVSDTNQGGVQAKVQLQSTPPSLTSAQVAALEAIEAENLGKDERYLKDVEVAKRFGIARQTVWKRVELGVLPAPIKLPPNSSRWRLSSLLAFEKKLAGASRQTKKKSRKAGHEA